MLTHHPSADKRRAAVIRRHGKKRKQTQSSHPVYEFTVRDVREVEKERREAEERWSSCRREGDTKLPTKLLTTKATYAL